MVVGLALVEVAVVLQHRHLAARGGAEAAEGLEPGVDAAEKRATAGFVDAPEMGAIEAALHRAGAWGDNSVSS